MKIYTKTGDLGETGLYGGKRVSKSELKIESYGTVDELNSYLGLIASMKVECINIAFIHAIQSKLFDIGALLASDPERKLKLPEVTESDIQALEQAIDLLDESLPQLKNFILPGGSTESAHVHVARTICRRAERRVVHLHQTEPQDVRIIQYLNRLSDYLFVLARKVVIDQGLTEIPWKASV